MIVMMIVMEIDMATEVDVETVALLLMTMAMMPMTMMMAMRSLMQDHARTDAMGRAGRARAEQVFDARTVAQQTLTTMGLG